MKSILIGVTSALVLLYLPVVSCLGQSHFLHADRID